MLLEEYGMICKLLHYRFLRSHLLFTIDYLALLHSLDTQVLCEHGECLCTSWCYGGSGAMAMCHGEGATTACDLHILSLKLLMRCFINSYP